MFDYYKQFSYFIRLNITQEYNTLIQSKQMASFSANSQINKNQSGNYAAQPPKIESDSRVYVKMEADSSQQYQKNSNQNPEKMKSNQNKGYCCNISPHLVQKILVYIKQLMDKYFIKYDQQLLESIFSKMMIISKNSKRSLFILKNLASAVFYSQFSDQIGIKSSRIFCLRNDLKTTLFNRFYRIYHDLYTRQVIKEEQSTQYYYQVINYNQDQMEQANQSNYKSANEKKEKGKIPVSPLNMLNRVYDLIFKTAQFQQQRRFIINKLVVLYEQVYMKYMNEFQEIFMKQDQEVKIYHILYYLLKKFKCSIYFYNFRECIFQQTGFKLKNEYKSQILEIVRTTPLEQKNVQKQTCKIENIKVEDEILKAV